MLSFLSSLLCKIPRTTSLHLESKSPESNHLFLAAHTNCFCLLHCFCFAMRSTCHFHSCPPQYVLIQSISCHHLKLRSYFGVQGPNFSNLNTGNCVSAWSYTPREYTWKNIYIYVYIYCSHSWDELAWNNRHANQQKDPKFHNSIHTARVKSFQHHTYTVYCTLEAVTPSLSHTVVRGHFSQTCFVFPEVLSIVVLS